MQIYIKIIESHTDKLKKNPKTLIITNLPFNIYKKNRVQFMVIRVAVV